MTKAPRRSRYIDDVACLIEIGQHFLSQLSFPFADRFGSPFVETTRGYNNTDNGGDSRHDARDRFYERDPNRRILHAMLLDKT